MSLNFQLGKINGGKWKEVCEVAADYDDPMRGVKKGDKIMNPETDALIWITLAIDIGEITAKNYKEFYTRAHIWERSVGAMWINSDNTPKYITLEQVKRHIGLRTNVFPKTSNTKFMEKLSQAVARDYIPHD